VTVEVMLQVIILLPFAYDVGFAWPVARIAILLKDELISSLYPWLDYRLKDLVDICSLRHLSIGVALNRVESKITLKVVPSCSPCVYSLHLFLVRIPLISLLYTVTAVTLTRPTSDI
jgi:hypothetical protein